MLIEAVTQTTLGNVYILTNDDDLHVGIGIEIESTYTDPATGTGADAIISWTGTHFISVEGTVRGADEAINLVGCVTAQAVAISATGQLFGGGDGVVNDADGVILDGVGSKLSNAGLIDAWGSAISAIVPDAGTTTVFNTGTMYGRVSGVWHKFGNGVLEFYNSGTVESPNAAYLGGISADIVVNAGQMIGTVDLGGGADVYDGRGGQVTGAVLGGEGDDRFHAGLAADDFDAGLGFDTLNLHHLRSPLGIDLVTPTLNSGAGVADDSFQGFERFVLGSAGDTMTGDGLTNEIRGAAGRDTIDGGAGADVLTGGAGKDALTGGTGADQFLYLCRRAMGDTIADFAESEDLIVLKAAAFGYGAVTGVLSADDFVSGAGSVEALDATDHFLFSTTDAKLWFDADGNGAGAAVLLADLQDGAALTAAGLLLI